MSRRCSSRWGRRGRSRKGRREDDTDHGDKEDDSPRGTEHSASGLSPGRVEVVLMTRKD